MSRVRDLASILTASSSMATDAEVSAVSAQIPANVAGKNKIINGDMSIWQRGTSFSSPVTNTFTADRWRTVVISGTVSSATQQALTPGEIPNFDGQYFQRVSISSGGDIAIRTRLEDARTLAGQTVTVSFYVKCSTAVNANLEFMALFQNFGSGGSAGVFNSTSSTNNTTWGTSWVRCSGTISVASVSGKTIGTNSFLDLRIDFNESFTGDVDITGVQVEAGPIATPFTRATGTIQGELAACQRYYWRSESGSGEQKFAQGPAYASGYLISNPINLPVSMRVKPTSLDYGGSLWLQRDASQGGNNITSIGVMSAYSNAKQVVLDIQVASGLTAGTYYELKANNSTSAYIGLNAEL